MRRLTSQRGISLIEALVSLLVLALGMLSFAALQSRLRLNSDLAKQRSEAVRIAQEDLENFRAFGTLSADATVTNNLAYSQITSGASQKTVLASNVTTTTNATYQITRQIVDNPVANFKDLLITVSWNDRINGAQTVTLHSTIAKNDPALSAALAIQPNGSPIRDLLGRDIQVPVPAQSLGDGTSAIKPLTGGTSAYVLSNDTGLVTKKCSVPASTVTTSLTTASLSGCVNVNGYLLSGFIRFSLGNHPDATSPNDVAPGPLAVRLDLNNTAPVANMQGARSLLLSTSWPAVTDANGTSTGYTAPECNAEALQTITYTTPVSYSQVNNGTTTSVTQTKVVAIIPQTVTSITAANVAPYVGVAPADANSKILSPAATGEKYVGYTCLVYPIDLDSNSGTSAAWTGRSTLYPTSGWSIGATSSTYKVCRYSSDYNLNGYVWVDDGTNITKIDNADHPYAYVNVQKTLSNQNFLVIAGNQSCPTDGAVEVNGTGGENYTDETTVLHQP
jgi:type IV pilus modification protein PilV